MLRIFLTALGTLAGASALAGTISGGGGGLRRYESNPWFLENTTTVRYCIEQDPAAFRLDEAVARRNVAAAIAYWQDYFRRWERDFPDGTPKFRVATQAFAFQETCDDGTDLRFQLGRLSDAQRILLGDPSQWAGAAALESYDPISLRGRGFIYVGADWGPDQMRSSAPIGDRPWQPCDGWTFQLVVLHELGHVFGIQHQDLSWIMAEREPEIAVSKGYVNALRSDVDGNICRPERWLAENDRFYVRALEPEFAFAVHFDGLLPRVETARISPSAQWRTLHFDLEGGGMIDLEGSYVTGNLVSVTLPPDHPDFENGNWYGYPSIASGTWKGELKIADKTYPLHAYTRAWFEPLAFAAFDPETLKVHEGRIYSYHPASRR